MKLLSITLLMAVFITACGSRDKTRETTAHTEHAKTEAPRLSQNDVQQMTADWPEKHQNVIKELTGKYGQPNEGTASMLIWRNNGSWKRTTVHRNHKENMLEQTAALDVPPEKLGDVALFNKQVVIDRNAGEVHARGNREEQNFLAINLTHEIVNGNMSPMEARRQFSTVTNSMKQSNSFTQGLRFPSSERTQQ